MSVFPSPPPYLGIESDTVCVTYFPHYYSTPCLHNLHEQCKGVCKFCPEKCRCECHGGEKMFPEVKDLPGGAGVYT